MSTDVEPRKTPFCGQRVFIANDQESTGTARFSPELRNSQPRCRTTKNRTHWSYQDLRFWATVRVDGLSTRPRSAWRAPTEHISNPTLYPQPITIHTPIRLVPSQTHCLRYTYINTSFRILLPPTPQISARHICTRVRE